MAHVLFGSSPEPRKGRRRELYAVREVWRLFLSIMFMDPRGRSYLGNSKDTAVHVGSNSTIWDIK